MILSKIENVKPEQKLNNDSAADNLQVSPAIGNTNVSSSCGTLHLNLHSKWFDMILSGIKKEEYREMKPFWHKRFLAGKQFDTITFSNGYGKQRRQFVIECLGVQSSLGIVEWGAPEAVCVYILKLGRILSRNNYC
jgi:hypothetical protein